MSSVLVDVPVVHGVPMPVMDVVGVLGVRHRDVPTTLAMGVLVPVVDRVTGWLALINVPVVDPVQMPVVDIVGVLGVRHRHVAATLAMGVLVPVVGLVLQLCGHDR